MDKFSGKPRVFVLFFIMLIHIPCVCGKESPIVHETPSIGKILKEKFLLWKKTHQSSLEKLKSIVREAQQQFFPPNLDFRGKSDANPKEEGRQRGRGKMKEAAQKSFKASKEAVEGSAESAGKMMGNVVQKTAETVIANAISRTEDSDSEL